MELIKLENISKFFELDKEKIHLLDKINLSIYTNDMICIIGSSGSGKTTLLNIIADIEDYDSGNLIRNQTTINYVTQYAHFIDELNIYENLILANLKNIDENKIKTYLTKFKCEHLLYKKPRFLSGGEKQRINIIRGLLSNPDILILDEPTASLDYDNKIKVVDFINEIHQENKLTIIVVTHDKDIVQQLNEKSLYELRNKQLLKV